MAVHCPTVWLDGHLSEEENLSFDLGVDAYLSMEFRKSPREKKNLERSLQMDEYSSQIGPSLWPKGLIRDQHFKDNKPNKMSGTNNTFTH